MSEELPKQDLLIKLLAMTTSDADQEVLTAIRRANALLRSAGWTWEDLIKSRIKIVEDPFKNLGTPSTGNRGGRPPGGYTPSPPPPPPPQNPQPSWHPARPSTGRAANRPRRSAGSKVGPSIDEL